jgi:uncharacterized damage-inducible protein DinB
MYRGDSYALMADYNAWMNRKLYAAAAGLPDAARKRDLGAFFKSLHGTLNHVLLIDLMFLARFTDQALPAGRLGEELHDDFDALRAEREATDIRILDWIAGLDRTWLVGALTFTSVVDGETRTLPRWVMLTQMFNHQTHHRGQATTLLKQLGVDPGITDIPWLPALYKGDAAAGPSGS